MRTTRKSLPALVATLTLLFITFGTATSLYEINNSNAPLRLTVLAADRS